MNQSRLIHLNRKADALLEFRYADEERSTTGRDIAVGTGLAAGGYGAYLYRNEIGNAARGAYAGARGAMGSVRQAGSERLAQVKQAAAQAQAAAAPAVSRVRGMVSKGSALANRTGAYAGNIGGAVKAAVGQYGSLRSGADVGLGLTRGAAAKKSGLGLIKRLGAVKFESKGRAIHLSAKLDSLIKL